MAIDPTDSEVIRDAMNARLGDVWTASVGRVQSYDAIKQVADVLPVVRRPLTAADGSVGHEDLPVIPNVPVLQPRAGGFFVHLPLVVGDTVLLIFASDSFQMWRESGSISNPGDLRRHSLSNAIAIPGIFPALELLTDPPHPGMSDTEAVLGGGVYRVGSATDAQFVALSNKVEDALSELKDAIANATPVAQDGGAALQTAIVSALSDWPPPLAASKLKSE